MIVSSDERIGREWAKQQTEKRSKRHARYILRDSRRVGQSAEHGDGSNRGTWARTLSMIMILL